MKTVTSATELAAAHGERVSVQGTVVRPEMKLGPGNSWQATGLELGDGTLVWVDYAKTPPPGWGEFEGKRVAVECKVWTAAPPEKTSAATGPHVSECGAPVSAPAK